MRGLTWSRPAREDIDRLEQWLDDNRRPDYALRVVRALHAKVALLTRSPTAGSRLKGDLRKSRVLKTPYLLIYLDHGDSIEIIRIFHERQDWQSLL